jgi:hypothetical protein
MTTTDHRLEQISTTDVTGADAYATVTVHPKRSIQSDAIDGQEARGISITVKLLPAERQRLQDVVSRACAKIDARRAARAVNAAVVLDQPLANEAP